MTESYGFEGYFSSSIHMDQSMDNNLLKALNWHCSVCCNLANGRVDIEERLAYKTKLHGGND